MGSCPRGGGGGAQPLLLLVPPNWPAGSQIRPSLTARLRAGPQRFSALPLTRVPLGWGVLGRRPFSGPVERRPTIPLPHRACLGCSLLHTTLSLLLLRATRRVLEVRSKSPSSAETTAVTPAGWNCTQKGLTPNVQGTGHTRARLSFKTPLKISPGKTGQVGTGEAFIAMAPPSYMQSPPQYLRAWFLLVCVVWGDAHSPFLLPPLPFLHCTGWEAKNDPSDLGHPGRCHALRSSVLVSPVVGRFGFSLQHVHQMSRGRVPMSVFLEWQLGSWKQ